MEWPTGAIIAKMFRKFSKSFKENKLFDGNINNDKFSNNQTYVGGY